VKLPLLLSQYLREHQKLRLPGLGSFYATGMTASTEADMAVVPNIRFEQTRVNEPDEGLIEFIKQKTGKIKPLAMADLDSYIESGLQMLNIGKPFYIEGIGTIQKNKEGGYEFVMRELSVIKMEETANDKPKADQAEKRKSVFDDEKYAPSTNPWQRVVVAALILGGLAIVVLGGYYLYNQNNGSARNTESNIVIPQDTTSQSRDSLNIQPDTAQVRNSYASVTPGSYKFVLETTNKKRALRRYTQLRSYSIPVKMETSDSVAYKLYFLIAATPADTTRIKDSLSRYYVSKVKIEQ
jgi:hypothetical protein